jgi:hypothetical protein
MTPDALGESSVASYLSRGDDITVKIHIDHLVVTWSLADTNARKALPCFRPLSTIG